MPDQAQTKLREEQKRDRAYGAVQRWRHIQETITWAEANLPPARRRNRPRVGKNNTTNLSSSNL